MGFSFVLFISLFVHCCSNFSVLSHPGRAATVRRRLCWENSNETCMRFSSEVARRCRSTALAFLPFIGVRRLSLLAEGGVYLSRYLLGYHTVGRTGTGDGCCFFLNHDASLKTKTKNKINFWCSYRFLGGARNQRQFRPSEPQQRLFR